MTNGAGSPGRHQGSGQRPGLAEFNADDAFAAEILGACLDIAEWGAKVCAGRPFADLPSLQAAGSCAAAGITWEQVAGALDRHPRIGERQAAAGAGSAPLTATESAWSGTEQSGVRAAQADALAAGNAAYEKRFGYIFLICAAGLAGEQIMAELDSRLSNDPESEKLVVIDQLRKICALRLAKAVIA